MLDIVALCCFENVIFLLHESAKSVSHLALLSPQEAARLLFCNEKYRECAQVRSNSLVHMVLPVCVCLSV